MWSYDMCCVIVYGRVTACSDIAGCQCITVSWFMICGAGNGSELGNLASRQSLARLSSLVTAPPHSPVLTPHSPVLTLTLLSSPSLPPLYPVCAQLPGWGEKLHWAVAGRQAAPAGGRVPAPPLTHTTWYNTVQRYSQYPEKETSINFSLLKKITSTHNKLLTYCYKWVLKRRLKFVRKDLHCIDKQLWTWKIFAYQPKYCEYGWASMSKLKNPTLHMSCWCWLLSPPPESEARGMCWYGAEHTLMFRIYSSSSIGYIQ